MSQRPQPGARALPLTALGGALGLYAALVVATIYATGGVFEYPLDDPYIHLALAEQIAKGSYGINPGEVSSPGSSPIFPLLLTPFAGSEVQRYLPAFWNLVGLAASAWVWGRLLFEAGYARVGWRLLGYGLAALGPAVLLMPQVAFLGMEHALHAAAALTVVLGLYRHLAGDRPGGPKLVVLGALIGSAFRFEGMALGLFAGIALVFTGRRGAGALAALFGFLPVAAFMAFLASLGLDPAPSSVQVKLADSAIADDHRLLRLLLDFLRDSLAPGGLLILGLTLALFLAWRLFDGVRESRLGALALTAMAAGVAHLLVGQIGWANRYEHYAVVLLAASLVALLPHAAGDGKPGPALTAVLAATLIAPVIAYQPDGTLHLPGGARAIHAQQGQMARFAQDVLAAPVAVNDIGRVAWRNPNYVLDLWGLASGEAREIRLSHPAPGWAEQLTSAHDVEVAMVYDDDIWLKDAIGPDWVRLGALDLTIPSDDLGGSSVAFYATTPTAVDMLRDRIAAWVPSLVPGSEFVWDQGMAP